MKTLFTIVAFTLEFMVFCQFGNISVETRVNSGSQLDPSVELSLTTNSKNATWGAQMRYGIQVRDQVDGNSKYGEIDPNQVFLSARFFPSFTDSSDLVYLKKQTRLANLSGLTLMGPGACFSCHADENSITGPSFSEIANSYNNGKRNQQDFIKSIREGSEGQWGSMTMPANPEYSEEEAAKMVEYIIRQGKCKLCWVYPGLDGVLRIITAPKDSDTGLYLLTASYTSSRGERGKDSIILKIR